MERCCICPYWIYPGDDRFVVATDWKPEIKFDKTKLVIKGKNNQVTDAIDVTPVMNIVKEARKSKRQMKKEERAKKKAERKNNPL